MGIDRHIRQPIALVTMLLISIATGTVTAEQPDSQLSMMDIQAALIQQYEQGILLLDFEGQLKAVKELHDRTQGSKNEPLILKLPEIEFIMNDLQKVAKLDPARRKIAEQQLAEQAKAHFSSQAGKHLEAARHFRHSLDLAEPLYGHSSYIVVNLKSKFAGTLLYCQENLDEAISTALDAKKVLETLNLTESYLYRELLVTLTGLYYEKKDRKSLIQTGEQAVASFQKDGNEHIYSRFALVTGLLAEALNQEKQHVKALQYARAGLNKQPPKAGPEAPFYLRLLQEYAQAKVAGNDYDKVPEAYEELLSVSGQLPGFPLERRLQYREDYLPILKTLGQTERYDQVQLEINQLKESLQGRKSRYSM